MMNEQKTSFQEWLLSERTIKLVLYSGAFLLVLAGLIYAREQIFALSGWAQLGLTMGATALVYAGGVALIRRSASLRVGGLALLGVAAGFAPVNFAFLYLFDLIDNMDERIVWLVASMICGLFYGLTMRLARTSMMTWFTALAVLSAYAAVISLLPIPFSVCLILMGIPPFILGYLSKRSRKIDWISKPLHTVAHIATPLLWLVSSGALLHGRLDHPFSWIFQPTDMNPWLMLLSSLMAIAFYLSNDWQNSTKWEQWLSVSMVTGSLVLTTFQLPLTLTLCMVTLMTLGVGYLLVAWKVEPTAGQILPLYIYGYALITIVNLLGSTEVGTLDFALIVTADVFVCLVAALVHRQKAFVTAAAVLLPFALASYQPLLPDNLSLGVLKVNTLSAAWGVCSIIYQLIGLRLRKQDNDETLSTVLIAIGSLLMLGVLALNGITENITLSLGLITLWCVLMDRVTPHDGWKFGASISGLVTVCAAYPEFDLPNILNIEDTILIPLYSGLLTSLYGMATIYRYMTTGKWKHWAVGFMLISIFTVPYILIVPNFQDPLSLSNAISFANLFMTTLIVGIGTLLSRKLFPAHLTLIMLYTIAIKIARFSTRVDNIFDDNWWITLTFGGLALLLLIGHHLAKRFAPHLRLTIIVYGAIAAIIAIMPHISTLIGWTADAIIAIMENDTLLMILSFGIAAVCLAFVWRRQDKKPTNNLLLVITSMLFTLIGLSLLPWNWDVFRVEWIGLAVGTLYMLLGWLLPGRFGTQLAAPYKWGGGSIALLSLTQIDFPDFTPTVYGILAIILGAALSAKGLRQRTKSTEAWVYTGIIFILTGIYTILADHNLITHEQLVIVPIGLVMLGMGWHERKQGRIDSYRALTLVALVIMFGSSFPSALNDDGSQWWLGLLLIIECVFAFVWGILNKSRNFVRLSVTTLLIYGGLQFYTVATTLGRFAQVGGIGLILLFSGLGLLIYRERLLQGHAELQATWKNEWRP